MEVAPVTQDGTKQEIGLAISPETAAPKQTCNENQALQKERNAENGSSRGASGASEAPFVLTTAATKLTPMMWYAFACNPARHLRCACSRKG